MPGAAHLSPAAAAGPVGRSRRAGTRVDRQARFDAMAQDVGAAGGYTFGRWALMCRTIRAPPQAMTPHQKLSIMAPMPSACPRW